MHIFIRPVGHRLKTSTSRPDGERARSAFALAQFGWAVKGLGALQVLPLSVLRTMY
jgi:hypothetical protein